MCDIWVIKLIIYSGIRPYIVAYSSIQQHTAVYSHIQPHTAAYTAVQQIQHIAIHHPPNKQYQISNTVTSYIQLQPALSLLQHHLCQQPPLHFISIPPSPLHHLAPHSTTTTSTTLQHDDNKKQQLHDRNG